MNETELLATIVELSRSYGTGTDWVIAGGGNTSVKNETHMWVKASGTTLRDISADQFVKMDRARLEQIWSATYPDDPDEREAVALQDLLDARADAEESQRPSVETLMHALFPHTIVFHTHPTLLNGLTCAQNGEAAAARLFPDEAVWIPTINPGYTLARDIYDRVHAWRAAHNERWPTMLIMQNHGLVVAGETPEEIHGLHERIVATLTAEITRQPEIEPEERDSDRLVELAEVVARAMADMRAASGSALERPVVSAFSNAEIIRRSESPETMKPLLGAFTPDHIVYSGHVPCFAPLHGTVASPQALAADVLHAISDYCEREGAAPKIVVVEGKGAVAIGTTEKKMETAYLLFRDLVRVAAYAESFGGSLFMPEDQIAFIRGWEVEKFREAQSTGE